MAVDKDQLLNWLQNYQSKHVTPINTRRVANPTTTAVSSSTTPKAPAIDWSPALGFLESGINKLFALGAGNTNVMYQAAKRQKEKQPDRNLWEQIGDQIGYAFGGGSQKELEQLKADPAAAKAKMDAGKAEFKASQDPTAFVEGVKASWDSDYTSPNYKVGKDVVGEWFPEADETQKFWGGLGVDILADPLTYLPGGVVAAPIRGATYGAKAAVNASKAAGENILQQAAKGTVAGVKGTVAGAPGQMYKAGRFTGALKPLGLNQWMQLRNYNSFQSLARSAGVGTDDLLKLADGSLKPGDLAKSMTAARAAAAGMSKSKLKPVTEEMLTNVGKIAQQYAKDAETIHKGVWVGINGEKYAAKAAKGAGVAGVSAYRGLDKPQNQMTEEILRKYGSRNFAGPSQTVTAKADDVVQEVPIDFGDGVRPTVPTDSDTISRSPLESLGLTEDMPVEEAYRSAQRTLFASMPENGGNIDDYTEKLSAYQKIFQLQPGPDAPPAANVGQRAQLAIESGNPTLYPEPTTAVDEFGIRVGESDIASRIDELGRINSELPVDEMGYLARTQIMDDAIESVVGAEAFAMARMTAGLNPGESFSKIVFGSDEPMVSALEMDSASVFAVIRALADLPIDIPGYTEVARKLVLNAEGKTTLEGMGAVEQSVFKNYKEAFESIGVVIDPEAMLRQVSVGDTQMLEDLAASGGRGTRAVEDLDAPEAAARAATDDTMSPLAQSARDAGELVDETADEVVDSALSLGDEVVEAEGTGQFVDIFGRVLDDPNQAIIKGVDDAAASIAGISAKRTGAETAQTSAEAFASRATQVNSANPGRFKGAMPLTHRKPANGKVTSHLAAPNVPARLNYLYDHIVGFARTPLYFTDWVNGLRAAADSEAATAEMAADLVKKLGLNDPAAFDAQKALSVYNRNYLQQFDDVLGDASMGVDMFGRQFVNKTEKEMASFAAPGAGKLSREAAAAKAAEEQARNVARFEARATRRVAVGSKMDAEIAAIANTNKSRAGSAASLADPVSGDPIHARPTTGAWLDASDLSKRFLRGSIAAYSENLVESSKLVGNGLRNGLRELAPLLSWKDLNYRIFEKAPFITDETQLKAVIDSLKKNSDAIGQTVALAVKDLVKGGKIDIQQAAKMLRGQGESFPTAEALSDGFIKTGKLVQNELYRNMDGVIGALEDAVLAGGATIDNVDDLRGYLWDAITKSLYVNKAGTAVSINQAKLAENIRKIEFETGVSHPAVQVSVSEGGILGAAMRTTAEKLEQFNAGLGVNIREVEGGEMLTAAQRGQARPHDINDIQKIAENIVVVKGEGGNTRFMSSNGAREYEAEWVQRVAEAIARSNGEEAIIAQFSSGNVLADYLRSRVPEIPNMINNEKLRRIEQVEAVNNTTLMNGDHIAELAKVINPDEYLQRGVQSMEEVFSRITNPNHVAEIDNVVTTAFGRAVNKLRTTGERIFGQDVAIHGYNSVRAAIAESGLFKAGTQEAWNAFELSLRKMRLAQQQAGLFEITKLSRYAGRMKPRGGIDPDFAYIGALDVFDSITQVAAGRAGQTIGMPADAARVIFEGHKIGGQAFPISVAQQAAVFAMKMPAAGLSETARIAWLNDMIIDGVQQLAKSDSRYADYAADLVRGPLSQNKQGESLLKGGKTVVAMLATALADPGVVARLTARHNERAALAVAVAEKNSVAITQPIMDALSSVADNIFSTAGATSTAMDEAIDELRKQLVKSGFVKGSLESLISTKMLDRHIAQNFTPAQLTTSRIQRRMVTAAKETGDKRRFVVNAERSVTARAIADEVNQAIVDDMTVAIEQAIKSDDPIAMAQIGESAANVADRAVETSIEFHQHLVAGSRSFAQRADTTEIGRQVGLLNAELDDLTQRTASALRTGLDKTNPEEFARIEAERLAVAERYYPLEEQYRYMKYGDEPSNARAEAEAQIVGDMAPDANTLDTPAGDPYLSSFENKNAINRFGNLISGPFGARDLFAPATQERHILDNSISAVETALEDTFRKFSKAIPENEQAKHVAAIVKIKSASQRAQYAARQSADVQDFLTELYTGAGPVLDGYFTIRAGLDAKHINQWISAFYGDTEKALARLNLNGEELIGEYLDMVSRMIEKGPGQGGDTWLQTLKGMNFALHNAMYATNVAADFSARWGNKALGVDDIDVAINQFGWKRINKSDTGTLAKFLDPTQAYPPEMLRQLAKMQKIVDYRDNLRKFKIIKATDAVTNFTKASMTIWQPANHMVNAVGEAMTNMLRGVTPLAYKDGLAAMHAGGHLRNVVAAQKGVPTNAFLGNADKGVQEMIEAASSAGMKVMIGNSVKVIPYAEIDRIFRAHGVEIANNSMEDFIRNEAGQMVKKGGWLSKAFSPIRGMNKGLGHFASRRDNVFRYAHAAHVLRTNSFRSIEEMGDMLRREISEWHPTTYGLSNFERTVMRRLIFFYTWQRGAIRKMSEAVIEHPGAFILPAKINYAASGAMGGEPQGIGNTMPNDPRIPSWGQQNFIGPHRYNQYGDVVTYSINAPGMDMMQKYFGSITYDSRFTPAQNFLENADTVLRKNTVDALTPIPNFIRKWTEAQGDYTKEFDMAQTIQDLTGFGKLSRLTDTSILNNVGFFQPRTGVTDPQEVADMQEKALWNMFTPFRPNIPSDYATTAENERKDENKIIDMLESGETSGTSWWMKPLPWEQ